MTDALKREAVTASGAHRKRQEKSWNQSLARFHRGLLLPSLLLMTAITIFPIIFLIGTSMTTWQLSLPGSLRFVGLDNYIRIFTADERFINSLSVQLRLTLFTVPLQMGIGLALAMFVQERFKNTWLVDIARTVFTIPMVIPPVVAALIWRILYTPEVSIFNWLVTEAGLPPLRWLGDANLALVAIAIADIWAFFPFCFLLLYAGLLSLPEEPREAAFVDGASGWQTFRFITLPMLRPTLNIVLLFRLVDSIRTFPMIFVMTQGGPGFATEPTNFYAYQQGFSFTYVGYSSAIIVTGLAFTLLLTYFISSRTRWGNQ